MTSEGPVPAPGGDGQPPRPADTGGDQWERLHPMSPVVRFGRALAALLVVLAPRALARNSGPPWAEVAAIAFAVVAGFTSWAVTKWRVVGNELQIETGLLRRQSLRVNAGRIQAVDIVRPALGRALGLAEVRVDVAGRGRNLTRLAYVSEQRAEAVRARLLALRHGLAPDAPAPPGRPVFAVRPWTLVAATLLGLPTLVLVALLVSLGVLATVDGSAAAAAGGVMVTALFSVGVAIFRRFAAEFEFRVEEAPDGLRVTGGLLQTRAETIPFARVQGVRWLQPVTWVPFGWCRLEIDVARQRAGGREGDASVGRALLPVGRPQDALLLLRSVFPDADLAPPRGARPPRVALLRAPLSYRRLLFWHSERFAYAGTGRLRRTLTVVPLEKAQSVRLVQGPVQRALGLMTLAIDTAGRGWVAAGRCRPAAEARESLEAVATNARRARGAIPSNRTGVDSA